MRIYVYNHVTDEERIYGSETADDEISDAMILLIRSHFQEPLDDITRHAIESQANAWLRQRVFARSLHQASAVCDASNNGDAQVKRMQLVLTITYCQTTLRGRHRLSFSNGTLKQQEQ